MVDELRGNPASPGTAAGPVVRLAPPPVLPEAWDVPAAPEEELAAASGALETAVADLEKRAASVTGESRSIMDTQIAMARDPSLRTGIRAAVHNGRPAAWAIHEAFGRHIAALESLGGYLGDRAADLTDIRDRAIAAALGLAPPGIPAVDGAFVLVGQDIAPADTVLLDPAKVVGIVTEKGGPTSHTAIVARALGIPAVVGCAGAAGLADGQTVAVDGTRGTVLADPGEDHLRRIAAESAALSEKLARHRGPGATADGHPVKLLLNVGGAGGAAAAAAADAEGVGLFRTEFLFLDRTEVPTVEEQRAAYGAVLRGFAGRPVVIRTLDAGADKFVPFANTGDEPNPALGVRGYRVGVRNPELLTAQLEAISLAAADHGADVRVMAPMIATPAEAAAFCELARSYGIGTAGVMVEVPAAAIRAADILAEADFVSIGTNDLSQYTYAADRLLGELGELLDPWQPALLALVANVAAAARDAGKSAGICGEAAGDPGLAPVFAGLGITSLSMSVSAVPAVRAALKDYTAGQCETLAREVLSAPDAPTARKIVEEFRTG
ncbi:phosphoenolpyruvate--protein phosphotransferase [Amycolatopsis rhizosphaerae]|uniref:Phosphoenolpyruvate-protein phosphotransferase n=1 Tax=Amycolatopsis rhizosphaerae TaxID=2053003 RepID=A0A558C7U1_9PSEU|nr:phosphoenolpyruvate--protein phosphotransferase [Amycolatopsis rhizosphaerae]TVT44747.1 phosphoenolpyruvate--protein phosphotransferase [Amycolatopsis rhizosphaerae]